MCVYWEAWKLDQERRQRDAELGRKGGRDSAVKRGPSSTIRDREDKNPPTPSKRRETPSSAITAPPGGQNQRVQTPGSMTTSPPAGKNQRGPPTKDFQGYRTGGELIHVSGRLQHLFPSDGGRITVEKVDFVQGSSLVKVAVAKDGHHFYTHHVTV
ncbi:hypothetical protein CRUP_028168, partial [Coryphaenoides rupestris]